ncbi:MAG TPA: flippase [Candidatus Dormibacteraeota bacterium]
MSLAARTFRNTALVVTARLLSKVMVFAVILIVIRAMGNEGSGNYGRFTSLVVYAALVSIVADLGLRPLFTREVAKDNSLLTPYLNSILSLKLVLSVPVLAILYGAVALGLPGLTPYVLPTFALLVATSFSNQLRATFYAVGQLRYEAIAIMAESLVLLVAAVVAALAHLPWWSFLWVYTASYAFTAVYAAIIAVRRFGHGFHFDLQYARLSMLARESLPFGLTVVLSTLYFKIDVPILKVFTSFVAVGIYGAAYKYLEAVVFVPQTLMDPIYPALSQLAQNSLERLAGAATKTYKLLAVVGFPVSLGMVVFAAPVIRYTIPGYEQAIPVLQVLAVGVFFLFVNNVFLYTLNAMGRQSDSTRLALISLVVNVALNLLLIPSRNPYIGGYMGAAWATGLTEIGLFIGGWFYLRKQLFAMPLLAPLKGVIAAGLLCGVLMMSTVLLLGPHLYAYALAAAVGAVVYAGGLFATHAFTPEELALAREGLRSRAKA